MDATLTRALVALVPTSIPFQAALLRTPPPPVGSPATRKRTETEAEAEGTMKAETAAKLIESALRVTGDLNEMAWEVHGSEPEDEFKRLRDAIGRVIGAIYF